MGTISLTSPGKPDFQMRTWRIDTSAGEQFLFFPPFPYDCKKLYPTHRHKSTEGKHCSIIWTKCNDYLKNKESVLKKLQEHLNLRWRNSRLLP